MFLNTKDVRQEISVASTCVNLKRSVMVKKLENRNFFSSPEPKAQAGVLRSVFVQRP